MKNKSKILIQSFTLLSLIFFTAFDGAQPIGPSCGEEYMSIEFNFPNNPNDEDNFQSWTVPANVSEVIITAIGASGGSYSNTGSPTFLGGLGTSMTGTFPVSPGQELSILVGEKGQDGNGTTLSSGGAGGGGTFVAIGTIGGTPIADLLIAAGGGGGVYFATEGNAATTEEDGVSAIGNPGSGGQGGNGGSAGQGFADGGGGGGWLSAASGATFVSGGSQIAGGPTPGAGGQGLTDGGFGGGGGGSAFGAGGGGGYSGGGGGTSENGNNGSPNGNRVGGGGGSFNSGENQMNMAEATTQDGNGLVIICYKPNPEEVPTMIEWSLILFGLLVLSLGAVFIYGKRVIVEKS